MSTSAERPVLVTGAHRSGTTWAGRVLAASPSGLGYVWEPFNPRHRPGTFPLRFPHYFHYVCAENAAECAAPLADTIALRYRPLAELRSLRSPKDAGRMARDWRRFAWARRRGEAALVKDPIALLSSEWLADTYDMRVVVMIRHPAAFAASILRLGWRHRFADFTDQPLLMRDLLGPHEAEIRAAQASTPELVDEAILLWNILYGVVAGFQERRADWHFVRHEDLATAPVAAYRDLYARIGLAWSDAVERLVRETSEAQDGAAPTRVDAIRRQSAALARGWRSRLPDAVVERIRAGTAALAPRWYSGADWQEPGMP
jgi:hypothetical protein